MQRRDATRTAQIRRTLSRAMAGRHRMRPSTTSREETFTKCSRDGRRFRAPYSDPRVIAGQGTCAREFIEQTGYLILWLANWGRWHDLRHLSSLSIRPPEVQIIARNPNRPTTPIAALRQVISLPMMMRPKPFMTACWCRSTHLAFRVQACHRHPDGFRTEIIAASSRRTLRIVMEASSAVPLATILKTRPVRG
jgi:threonine dehydratase